MYPLSYMRGLKRFLFIWGLQKSIVKLKAAYFTRTTLMTSQEKKNGVNKTKYVGAFQSQHQEEHIVVYPLQHGACILLHDLQRKHPEWSGGPETRSLECSRNRMRLTLMHFTNLPLYIVSAKFLFILTECLTSWIWLLQVCS